MSRTDPQVVLLAPAYLLRTRATVLLNNGSSMTQHSACKVQLDAMLLKLPGVSARKINNLDAYFVVDKMFACISGDGVGLRLPAATARELHFSRESVGAFEPGGMASSREWIQINRAVATEYEKDLELFQASIDFVKGSKSR